MAIVPDKAGQALTGRSRVEADAASRSIPIDIVERPQAASLKEAAARVRRRGHQALMGGIY